MCIISLFFPLIVVSLLPIVPLLLLPRLRRSSSVTRMHLSHHTLSLLIFLRPFVFLFLLIHVMCVLSKVDLAIVILTPLLPLIHVTSMWCLIVPSSVMWFKEKEAPRGAGQNKYGMWAFWLLCSLLVLFLHISTLVHVCLSFFHSPSLPPPLIGEFLPWFHGIISRQESERLLEPR